MISFDCVFFWYSDFPLHFSCEGTDSILLDDVECTGSETAIADCPNAGWGESNCGHSEDAGVVCLTDEGRYFDLCNFVHHSYFIHPKKKNYCDVRGPNFVLVNLFACQCLYCSIILNLFYVEYSYLTKYNFGCIFRAYSDSAPCW